MIDVVLLEFAINLYNFLPDEKNLGLTPFVVACLLAILHNIQQTALKVLKDHHKRIESSPAHHKVVQEMSIVQREMNTYFVDALLQPDVAETVELYYLCQEALLFV